MLKELLGRLLTLGAIARRATYKYVQDAGRSDSPRMDGSRRNPFEATGSASASFALRPALKSARGCGDASFELNASAFAVGSNDKILRLDLAVLIRAVQITAPLNIDTSFAISFAAWLIAEKRDLGRAHSLMRPESDQSHWKLLRQKDLEFNLRQTQCTSNTLH